MPPASSTHTCEKNHRLQFHFPNLFRRSLRPSFLGEAKLAVPVQARQRFNNEAGRLPAGRSENKRRGQYMKAVILAGGLGTRIAEESDSKPKPMVEIGGRPLLWHIMKTYSHHGINDFII